MHVQRIFWYNSLPSSGDHDVELPNFTIREQRERKATIFLFLLWTWIQSFRTQLQKKPRENEKVVKSTEELALFQLHHYTSFNSACRTGAIFFTYFGAPCLPLLAWKTQEKNVCWASWIERGIVMKLKQRQFFGRFDNFLIFARFVWILILHQKKEK